MSEWSRSRSGSVSSKSSSIASTPSAKQVAMNRVQKTYDKHMRVVGVNGCTSMHLFGAVHLYGASFIVGAHAAPGSIPVIARQAADLAGEGVTSIVIWAPPVADDGIDDGDNAVTELRGRYPQAQISVHRYVVDNSSNLRWWEFEARQGFSLNPGTVSAKHCWDAGKEEEDEAGEAEEEQDEAEEEQDEVPEEEEEEEEEEAD